MIKLIWDDCTPTAERRPTYYDDIQNDIHVEEFDSEEELLDQLLDLSNFEEDDILDLLEDEEPTFDNKVNCILSSLSDPGDGSPNILYLNINGKEYDEAMPYDELEDLDLATCSEEDVKEILSANIEDDEDWDDDDIIIDEEDKAEEYAECVDELNTLNLSSEQYDYYKEGLDEIRFEDKPSIKNGHSYTSFEDVMNDARNASEANDEKDSEEFEFTITLLCDGEADTYKKLEHHMDYLLPEMIDGDLEVWDVKVDDSNLERVVVKGRCNQEDFEIDIDGWPHVEDFDVDIEEK